MTLTHRKAFGTRAEQVAADDMIARGWTVLHRNFRSRAGEIDIVALHGQTLVFCEVKARHAWSAVSFAAEAVNQRKQLRLIRVAREFLARYPRWQDAPCRFDVVALCLHDVQADRWEIDRIEDAFRPGW
jgi:putative endonuclease